MIFTRRRRTSFLFLAVAAFMALWFLRNPPAEKDTEMGEAQVVVATPARKSDSTGQAGSYQAVTPQVRPEVVDKNSKVKLLHEILASGNDNDERMDTHLKSLSLRDREDLRSYYRGLAREDRNGRGTTLFLLGRNLQTKEDFEFFAEVLAEEPCHSLTDCDMAEDPVVGHVEEHDTSQAVTLVYPQLVALKGLENVLSQPALRKQFSSHMREAIENARSHPDARVSGMANNLAQRIGL